MKCLLCSINLVSKVIHNVLSVLLAHWRGIAIFNKIHKIVEFWIKNEVPCEARFCAFVFIGAFGTRVTSQTRLRAKNWARNFRKLSHQLEWLHRMIRRRGIANCIRLVCAYGTTSSAWVRRTSGNGALHLMRSHCSARPKIAKVGRPARDAHHLDQFICHWKSSFIRLNANRFSRSDYKIWKNKIMQCSILLIEHTRLSKKKSSHSRFTLLGDFLGLFRVASQVSFPKSDLSNILARQKWQAAKVNFCKQIKSVCIKKYTVH